VALGDEAMRAEKLATTQSIGTFTAFLDRVITSLSALSGLAMESMTRGHGWRFLDMGRRLERALQLVSLLRAAFASGAEHEGALLETLLAVADSSITYRRRYLAGLHPAAVADLLLVDDSNPRAVLFQIAALREHLLHLPRDASQARLRPEERLALGALARLQLLDVVPACLPPADGARPRAARDLGRDRERSVAAFGTTVQRLFESRTAGASPGQCPARERSGVKYRIRHLTRYRYSEAVTNSQHDLHLLPRDLPHQHCLWSELEIKPAPSVCEERTDYFGNRATHMVLASAHSELSVVSHSRVEVTVPVAVVPEQDLPWESTVRKSRATEANCKCRK
jgi:hypothetical protein